MIKIATDELGHEYLRLQSSEYPKVPIVGGSSYAYCE